MGSWHGLQLYCIWLAKCIGKNLNFLPNAKYWEFSQRIWFFFPLLWEIQDQIHLLVRFQTFRSVHRHNSTVLLGRVTDQFLLSRSTTRGWGLCVLYMALSCQKGSTHLRRGQRSPFFLTFEVEILRFGGLIIMEACKHPMQASKHPFNSLNKQYWCFLCEMH